MNWQRFILVFLLALAVVGAILALFMGSPWTGESDTVTLNPPQDPKEEAAVSDSSLSSLQDRLAMLERKVDEISARVDRLASSRPPRDGEDAGPDSEEIPGEMAGLKDDFKRIEEQLDRMARAVNDLESLRDRAILEELRSLSPDDIAARGKNFMISSRQFEACKYFEYLVTSYPDHEKVPDALWELGWYYDQLDESRKAINYFDRLIQEHPDHDMIAHAHYHSGYCFEDTGDLSRAMARYEKARDLLGKNPAFQAKTLLGMARIRKKRGDLSGAASLLRTLIEECGQDERAEGSVSDAREWLKKIEGK